MLTSFNIGSADEKVNNNHIDIYIHINNILSKKKKRKKGGNIDVHVCKYLCTYKTQVIAQEAEKTLKEPLKIRIGKLMIKQKCLENWN